MAFGLGGSVRVIVGWKCYKSIFLLMAKQVSFQGLTTGVKLRGAAFFLGFGGTKTVEPYARVR